MIKWTLHTHTVVSDGEMTEEELVKQAAEEGLEGLAITDHFPYPYYPIASTGIDWASSHRALALQVKNIKHLRSRYLGLTVLAGVEVEYVEELDLLENWIHDLDLDFVLGGVHLLGKWALDWSEEEFLKGGSYFGSLELAFQKYFGAVEKLAESGIVDSIAHLDIVKKYNAAQCHFSEQSEWYRELVEQCLQGIAAAGIAIEVNTAGLRKPIGELYPSGWILGEALDLGIRVTVGTDVHKKDEKVGIDLQRAEEALRAAGYESYLTFKRRESKIVEL